MPVVVDLHGYGVSAAEMLKVTSAEAYKLPLPAGAKGNLSRLLGNNVPQSTKGPSPSIPKTTAAWAARDGCAPAATTRAFAKKVALISYACPGGATVSLFRITGGGHTWPGSVWDRNRAASARRPWPSRPTRSSGPSSSPTRSGLEAHPRPNAFPL